MNRPERSIILAAACAGLLAACGGGGDSTPDTGTLGVSVTDAPVDSAAAVVVTFTSVEVKPENGEAVVYELNPAQSLDLLALAGGDSATLLDEQTMPAGRYEWIRLHVEAEMNVLDSYIELETGEQYPLYVPSGSETGLKLVRGFNVAAGGRSDFTIDFDLRKSVVAPPGLASNYILKPALRIVDNLQVGSIEGTVVQALIPDGCAPFVYVFEGAGVTPDDMDTTAEDVDPLISVPVELDSTSAEYRYLVSFLEAGDYTVSFTCDGDIDTPEGDEVLEFSGTTDVSVTANDSAVVNFE